MCTVSRHPPPAPAPLTLPVFLHPYAETPWEAQVTGESLAERTVRATVHARRTLLAGFTTVRCVRARRLGRLC